MIQSIADHAHIKCESDELLKSWDILKKCWIENVNDFKELAQELKKDCKNIAKHINVKQYLMTKLGKFSSCYELYKIGKHNPLRKCSEVL